MNTPKLILSNKPLELEDYSQSINITEQAEKLQQLLVENVPNMAYYHFDLDYKNVRALAIEHAQKVTQKDYVIDVTENKSLARIWEEVKSNANNLAAIIVDPLAVFTNSKPALGEYLREIRRITFLNQALFILDETHTGFRIGLGGAQVEFDVDVDTVLLGGVLTGGYDMGILGITEKYMPSELYTLTNDVAKEALLAGEYIISQLMENRWVFQELERRGREFTGKLSQKPGENSSITQLASIIKYTNGNKEAETIFLNLATNQISDYL